MKHAYLITAHTNFRILNLLFEALDDPDNDFYLLFDKKLKLSDEEIIRYQPEYSKIFTLPRAEINWGGYSLIDAELSLIKAALQNGYDYYHYMQGSDFPIKSKEEILSFFERNKGQEFIDFKPDFYQLAHFRCDYYHPFADNRLCRTQKWLRYLDYGVAYAQKAVGFRRGKEALYFGSTLFSITHGFAQYVVRQESSIKKRFRKTIAADEVFLQTLLMESDFKNNSFRFGQPYSNCYLVDWSRNNGNSPYTFVTEDYRELITSDPFLLFARKFNEEEDFHIIELLFEHITKNEQYPRCI